MKRLLVLDIDDTLLQFPQITRIHECENLSEDFSKDLCVVYKFYTSYMLDKQVPNNQKVIKKVKEELSKGVDSIVITSRATIPATITIEQIKNIFPGTGLHERIFIGGSPRDKSITLATIVVHGEFENVVVVDDKKHNFEMIFDALDKLKKLTNKEGLTVSITVFHPEEFVEVDDVWSAHKRGGSREE